MVKYIRKLCSSSVMCKVCALLCIKSSSTLKLITKHRSSLFALIYMYISTNNEGILINFRLL